MKNFVRWLVVPVAIIMLALSSGRSLRAQSGVTAGELRVEATSVESLRVWDPTVAAMERSGALTVSSSQRDPDVPFRTLERLDQRHRGVRIWGSSVVRNSERNVPVSLFGMLAPDLNISVEPQLTLADANAAFIRAAGVGASVVGATELVVLPMDSGDHRLAYTAVVASGELFRLDRVFLDANSGAELMRIAGMQSQQAVGVGRGVLGDQKKLSVRQVGASFVAFDTHRPPEITTFDMRGDSTRAGQILLGRTRLADSDVASDADNVWTDPGVVDAHAHIGMTYDYYYKRFGRSGFDGRNSPILVMVNGANAQNHATAPGLFINNAAWFSDAYFGLGFLVFGSGLPAGVTSGGKSWAPLSGSLDTVAHELTHAVTSSTSRLIYRHESGALDESFSDMMGKGAEFFYRPVGSNVGQADYVIGKDIVRAATPAASHGIRSMSNPRSHNHPDHYAIYRNSPDTAQGDLGGIHSNSGIPNHVFYLAIEGGTVRTSGVSVQGVGAANRELIEQVFYRAFTLLMPQSADFAMARQVTIQAARDRYGVSSAAERAITQAWDAVGVPSAAQTWSLTPLSIRQGAQDARIQTFPGSSNALGIFQVNVRAFDPTRNDIDLYLTTTTCNPSLLRRRPLPSCVLAASDSSNSWETASIVYRGGQQLYIWVDNFSGSATTVSLTGRFSPYNPTAASGIELSALNPKQ